MAHLFGHGHASNKCSPINAADPPNERLQQRPTLEEVALLGVDPHRIL